MTKKMSFNEAMQIASAPETESPAGREPAGLGYSSEEEVVQIQDTTVQKMIKSFGAPHDADSLIVTVSGVRYSTPVGKSIGKTGKRYIDRPASGTAVHLSLPWAEYVAKRQHMDARTMLVCGTFEDDDADEKRVLNKAKAGGGDLTISNSHLAFRDGPGVLRIDFDVKRLDEVEGLWPEKPKAFDSPEDLARTLTDDLVGLFPGLEGVACLAFYSTGSNISDADGNRVSGAGGIRIEIPVADASKIPEFLEVICERSWLLGWGWAFVSESGAILTRGIADEALSRPHQPDYCAPHLLDGYTQDRCWYLQSGRPLVALEPLSDKEKEKVADNKRKASEALAEASARVKAEAKGKRVDALVKKGVPPSQAAERVERLLECGELLVSEEVVTVDGEELVLDDLIAAGKDRGGLRDPIEPDYQGGKDVAKFFFNDGFSYVYSQAHGGRRYELLIEPGVGLASRMFGVLPPLKPEEQAEQEEIRARNQSLFDRAKRVTEEAFERERIESGGREAFEQARRQYQREENARIGEGEHRIPKAEVVTLQQALTRFVFLSDGSRVADMFNPHYDLPFADWAGTYAASFEPVPQPERYSADGSKKAVPDKLVPVSGLWKASPERKTVVCRTFKAGGEMVLPDPHGRLALNLWKPFDRSLEVADIEAAGVGLFLDHVEFLFGKDAGRFLDWLAHIEQRPGELPHTAWLHIAKNFGMGRNWLASVLTRVWAGSVAANLDLVGMLGSGFNGRLSRKVLAIVDEIREGGRESQWAHSEKLKSTINEETRTINPKFGRESVEYNSCRWLMFSNHTSAIPLENGDRRIEVVSTTAAPKGEEYYKRLYAALGDPRFIAAVASFLGARDISRFNPGAHAVLTEAKKAATQASQSEAGRYCEMLIEHWPSDLITSADLYQILAGSDFSGRGCLTPGHRRVLEDYSIEPLGKTVRVGARPTRVVILRDAQKWKEASTDEMRAELQKAEQEKMSAREYLEDLAAAE